jgi:Ca2+-binding EF-hand superfamily protein
VKQSLIATAGILALALASSPARAQADRKPGDLPGPIDSLMDLQDTGRMVFKIADENNDGQISQKEATDALNHVVGGFFFQADKNGDGVLSQDEARQSREEFLATKPWLRYVVETARAAKPQPNTAGQPAPNTNSKPAAALEAILDTNNDKQLQASEVRQAVTTAVQGFFAQADTNRDNQLSPSELNASVTGIARTAAQAAFQQADADNNGQISQAEFEKAIVEPARVAFRVLDLNHDGQISQQEAQTARQVVASRIRMLNMPEPANSPRNTVNSALGNPTQPQPTAPPAPR